MDKHAKKVAELIKKSKAQKSAGTLSATIDGTLEFSGGVYWDSESDPHHQIFTAFDGTIFLAISYPGLKDQSLPKSEFIYPRDFGVEELPWLYSNGDLGGFGEFGKIEVENTYGHHATGTFHFTLNDNGTRHEVIGKFDIHA